MINTPSALNIGITDVASALTILRRLLSRFTSLRANVFVAMHGQERVTKHVIVSRLMTLSSSQGQYTIIHDTYTYQHSGALRPRQVAFNLSTISRSGRARVANVGFLGAGQRAAEVEP